MDAKKYAENFLVAFKLCRNEADIKGLFTSIIIDFSDEVIAIGKSKGDLTAENLIETIKSQDQKWRKFADIVNRQHDNPIIKETGFIDFTLSTMPELKGLI